MANCEKILISGFSGAGKSTLLQEAKKSAPAGWGDFSDLDELILRHFSTGQDLATLIGQMGWEEFRRNEKERLLNWIEGDFKGVLSLGGGSLTPETFALLSNMPKVCLVHLHCDFETCWERLTTLKGVDRPLVKKGKPYMEELYQERMQTYQLVSFRLENLKGTDISTLGPKFWSLLPLK